MFTAIASSRQPIRLHQLQGTIIASTGPYIARAQGGQLLEQRKTEAVAAPDDQGVFSPPLDLKDIRTIDGRWPDCAWTSAEVGWAFSGRTPYPREGMLRWDEGRGQWVEQPGIAWARSWADGVLAVAVDGKLRWVDGSDRPIPPLFVERIVPDFLSLSPCRVSKDGDVLFEIQRSPHFAPGWWLFPRGGVEGERLDFQSLPELAGSSAFVNFGPGPYDWIAQGRLASEEPFGAYHLDGRWHMLPQMPLSSKWVQRELVVSPLGGFYMVSFERFGSLSICRLVGGQVWEPIPIFFYPNRCFPSDYQLRIGEEGELWLAIDFGELKQNDVVLYHAHG